MKSLPKLTADADVGDNSSEGFVIGAGAADWTYLQRTHLARTHDKDGSYEQIATPPEKTAMSILGNLFVSEGKPGPVLEVKCKKRTGEDNFPSCIRMALEQAYP